MRLALACYLPGRLLDRPSTRWASGKIAPEKESPLDTTSVFQTTVCGVRLAHFKTYGFPLVPLFLGSLDRTDPVWKLNDHKCAFVLESVADKLLKDFCTVSLSPRISTEQQLDWKSSSVLSRNQMFEPVFQTRIDAAP